MIFPQHCEFKEKTVLVLEEIKHRSLKIQVYKSNLDTVTKRLSQFLPPSLSLNVAEENINRSLTSDEPRLGIQFWKILSASSYMAAIYFPSQE